VRPRGLWFVCVFFGYRCDGLLDISVGLGVDRSVWFLFFCTCVRAREMSLDC
jgi:hypothetical protein